MGEFTTCNYCDLERMKARYGKKKGRLVKSSGDFGLGGVNYHYLETREELPSNENFVAWFMELTDRCVC